MWPPCAGERRRHLSAMHRGLSDVRPPCSARDRAGRAWSQGHAADPSAGTGRHKSAPVRPAATAVAPSRHQLGHLAESCALAVVRGIHVLAASRWLRDPAGAQGCTRKRRRRGTLAVPRRRAFGWNPGRGRGLQVLAAGTLARAGDIVSSRTSASSPKQVHDGTTAHHRGQHQWRRRSR
jgi:hypothetical protein